MSSNKKVISDEDLDDRMTDETRQYVKRFLENNDPRAMLYTDVNLIRSKRDSKARETNEKLKLENLDQKEFLVDSSFDDYKIPVTAYIPKKLI